MATEGVLSRYPATKFDPDSALRAAAAGWFVVAVLGQWIFVAYLLLFYGGSALSGDLDRWAQVLASGGIVPGDPLGNIAIAAHIGFAVIIMVGGPLQLVPAMRRRFPALHRWNGRVYMTTAVIVSIAGLYMEVARHTVGSDLQKLGTALDGILVIVFAAIALRFAIRRQIGLHRRWALRLFMVVSAVWFYRVGLMFWILLNQGPAGFDPETFEGPFLVFLGFAQYLIPLAILELYLRARDSRSPGAKYAMTAGLVVVTLAMGVGIFGATMGLWLPHMHNAAA